VSFSAKEFQLLRYLIDHKGETISREKMLQEVWGYTPFRLLEPWMSLLPGCAKSLKTIPNNRSGFLRFMA
jgi:hypothetical protein